MQEATQDAIQICLMGTPRIKSRVPSDAVQHLNADAQALELTALLILSLLAETPTGNGFPAGGRMHYADRAWLVEKLFIDRSDEKPKPARDRLSFLLKKINAALGIRARHANAARERDVFGVTLNHVGIDVRGILTAARQPYDEKNQDLIIRLGERRLLEGMEYSWLVEPVFQELRQSLDTCYLDALERKADLLLVKMQGAMGLGEFDQAGVLCNVALPLLDRAAERLTAMGQQSRAPRFAELRAKASYLTPPGEDGETPASLQDASSARGISRYVTSFVGREAEQARLAARLSSERIVTITGMGGCGKTRLALQAALDHEESTGMQTWLVELASVTDPGFVAEAVAAAIDLPKQKNRTTMDALIGRFRTGRTLLILDNCEQVTISEDGRDGCAPLAATLTRFCPGLTILATSRQPLNIDGEALVRLSPLRVPPVDLAAQRPDDPVAALLEYDAARLFVDRVRLHHEFSLSVEHVAPITAICASLDGIPFALELAAARTRSLSITRVNELLTDRFQFLTDGRATALPRHKTLRAVIDWSYDLLTPEEKALLCRVSIFAGGWTLEAAQSVAADFEPDVLDLLTSLIDKSLVVFDPAIDPDRYRMLETVRQYAHDQLREQYLWSDARLRHRAYCLRLAEEAAPHLTGPDPGPWLNRLETEIENLRVALEWRADETALRLVCALQRFWQIRSYFREGRRWLERDWEDVETLPIELRATALTGAGNLAFNQGAFSDAKRLCEQSLELWALTENLSGKADALHCLGTTAAQQGSLKEAEKRLQDALEASLNAGYELGIVGARQNLGNVAHWRGDYAYAQECFAVCLPIRRTLGDAVRLADLLGYMGTLATHQNRFDEARDFLNECLALNSSTGARHRVAQYIGALADLERFQGNHGEARKQFETSIRLMREVGDSLGIAAITNRLAIVAYDQNDLNTAEAGFEQARAMMLALGNERSAAGMLCNMAIVAVGRGENERAVKLFQECIAALHGFDAPEWIAECLSGLGMAEAQQGRSYRAATLFGAAETIYDQTGYCPPVSEKERILQSQAAVREMLGDEAYAAAYEIGRAMTNEEAFAFALEEGVRPS